MRQFHAALVGAVGLLLAHSVYGSVLTESTTRTGETINNVGEFGGELAQFNPSLGTLESVQLAIAGEVNYNAAFAADASLCPLLESEGSECFVVFSFSTGYSFNAPGFPLTDFMEGSSFFASANFFGSAGTSDLSPQSDEQSISYVGNPATLDGYIGLGDVDINGGISEDSDECDDFGVFCTTFSHTATITTTLAYTYSAVPEPGTIWLFTSALLGVALIRRRPIRL